jgi:DNA-directed RNA polymerase subunit M/transcription elongation factor TFIIS
MFCPECGTLSFPNPKGEIACTNYKCGYNGPANVVIKDQTTGKEVDLSQATSSTESRARVYDVIKDSDKRHSYLEQTRSSDEPETRMLTCKDCGKGWREY